MPEADGSAEASHADVAACPFAHAVVVLAGAGDGPATWEALVLTLQEINRLMAEVAPHPGAHVASALR